VRRNAILFFALEFISKKVVQLPRTLDHKVHSVCMIMLHYS
jgi:hypothetical protein